MRAISAIEAAVARWPATQVRLHRFGGIGFFQDGRETSHIHGNGLLDCFVGREQRNTLISAGRALPHHIFPKSGWISFWIEDEEDIRGALELIAAAARHRTT